MDFGIVLFNRDLRARFINRRFGEIWNIKPAFLAATPTFRELLDNAAANGWYALPTVGLTVYLDARETEVRGGEPPTPWRGSAPRCDSTAKCSRIRPRILETQLRRLATTDGLTGALNRAECWLRRSARSKLARRLGEVWWC